MLTGDLVHEGTEEDYRYLREVIERERGGIPVIPVLGNHDFKQAFYRATWEKNAPAAIQPAMSWADTAFWYWIRPRRATAAA